MSRDTIEIPAQVVEKIIVLADAPDGTVETCGTRKAGFESVKHLLSSKPLKRPARRLPATAPAPAISADEEAERQLLMRRVSRNRAEEIARKTPSPDPWLDDKYD
jgi:hypothetical protein